MATIDVEKSTKTKLREKKATIPNHTNGADIKPASIKNKKTVTKAIMPDKTVVPDKAKKSSLKIGKSKSFNPEIIEKLKKIISPYTEHPELLKHIEKDTNVNFVEKLNIDSVDVVEIVVDVEQEFKITIEDREIETFKTFEDMYNLIEAKINAVAGNDLAKAV